MPHDLTETQRLTIRNSILSTLHNVGQGDAALATALSHILAPVVAQMLADERERIAHEIDAERYTDRWGDDGVRFGLSIAARIARGQA